MINRDGWTPALLKRPINRDPASEAVGLPASDKFSVVVKPFFRVMQQQV